MFGMNDLFQKSYRYQHSLFQSDKSIQLEVYILRIHIISSTWVEGLQRIPFENRKHLIYISLKGFVFIGIGKYFNRLSFSYLSHIGLFKLSPYSQFMRIDEF